MFAAARGRLLAVLVLVTLDAATPPTPSAAVTERVAPADVLARLETIEARLAALEGKRAPTNASVAAKGPSSADDLGGGAFCCFRPSGSALGEAWLTDVVEHVILIHGFAHSGTTLAYKILAEAAASRLHGRSCRVGRIIFEEAQWIQTVYPAWARPKRTGPTAPGRFGGNECTAHEAWARAYTYDGKRDALYAGVSDADRRARGSDLLDQWRIEGEIFVGDDFLPTGRVFKTGPQRRGGTPCGTWIAKDPRFDTLTFLPWLLSGHARTTSVLLMRHPWKKVFLSTNSGGRKPVTFAERKNQFLDVWRHNFKALADARENRYCVVRIEDIAFDAVAVQTAFAEIAGGDGRRRATYHPGGKGIDPRQMFNDRKNNGKTKDTSYSSYFSSDPGDEEPIEPATLAFFNRTFGYSLAYGPNSTRLDHPHRGCLFSRRIYGAADARDRPFDDSAVWPPAAAFEPVVRDKTTGNIKSSAYSAMCNTKHARRARDPG